MYVNGNEQFKGSTRQALARTRSLGPLLFVNFSIACKGAYTQFSVQARQHDVKLYSVYDCATKAPSKEFCRQLYIIIGQDFTLMATCKSCGQALVLELDPDDYDEATSSIVGGSPTVVPDDLELPCNCHFHW